MRVRFNVLRRVCSRFLPMPVVYLPISCNPEVMSELLLLPKYPLLVGLCHGNVHLQPRAPVTLWEAFMMPGNLKVIPELFLPHFAKEAVTWWRTVGSLLHRHPPVVTPAERTIEDPILPVFLERFVHGG